MMLRKIRLIAATLCFVLITLLFLDFTGTLHGWQDAAQIPDTNI